MEEAQPTLDPYSGWSTPGFGDATVNNQSADWSAGAVLPGARDWSDVLKLGFGRLVDAKVRPVQPENAAPVLQKTQAAATSSPANIQAGSGNQKLVLAVVGTLAAAGLLYFVVKSARGSRA